jgi:hypothetical protein
VTRRRSPLVSIRRSFTRGALTAIVPAPSVTFRVRPLPLRTTRAWPASSRSWRCASRYAATSVSSAATSIRRAPSRAISSSRERQSTSSCAASLPTTLSMDGASFPPRALGPAVDQAGGYAARVTGPSIHNFWSYLGASPHQAPVSRDSTNYRASGILGSMFTDLQTCLDSSTSEDTPSTEHLGVGWRGRDGPGIV